MNENFNEKWQRNTLFVVGVVVLLPSIIWFAFKQNFYAMGGLIFFTLVCFAFSMPGILKFIKLGKFEARFSELEQAVAPIIAKESEPETVTGVIKSTLPSITMKAQATHNRNSALVIRALGNSTYSLRTVSGLTKSTKLSRPTVINELEKLGKQGLVWQATGSGTKSVLWGLSSTGRFALDEINSKKLKSDVED